MPEVPDKLLWPWQVADLFHVTVRSVHRWRRQGKVTCVTTPGGHGRFPAGQFQQYLNPSKRRPAMTPPIEDKKCLEIIDAALRRWEREQRPDVRVSFSGTEAWVVLAYLQLASRHPEVDPDVRTIAVDAARRIQDQVCVGDELLRQVAEQAWDPAITCDPADQAPADELGESVTL